MRVDGGKTLNPGHLRHRITWQRKAISGQDSFGQDIYTWDSVITTQCQVLARPGNEKEKAFQEWAEANFLIKMHYVDGILREMRGVWGDRYLDVLDSEDPWGTRTTRQVMAKEWVE